jgi:hypothetical protein
MSSNTDIEHRSFGNEIVILITVLAIAAFAFILLMRAIEDDSSGSTPNTISSEMIEPGMSNDEYCDQFAGQTHSDICEIPGLAEVIVDEELLAEIQANGLCLAPDQICTGELYDDDVDLSSFENPRCNGATAEAVPSCNRP